MNRKESRAIAYLRLSKDRAGSTSIDKQRASIERYCAERDWTILETFEDVDFSGRTTKRPGYQAMLGRLPDVDVLVVHRLDRLMRSMTQLARLLERLQEIGVQLVSTTEAIDSSNATGRMILGVLGSIAEIESDNVSARVTATREHNLKRGRVMGRARAFGWRWAPDGWEQVPEEAEWTRRMARSLLAGKGYRAIAGELESAGVPTAMGGTWRECTVRQILASYRLIGYLTWHGAPATVEPVLPPILTAETFAAVQAEMRRRKRKKLRYTRDGYLLTGLVYCECGNRMYRTPIERPYGTYRCTLTLGHGRSISARFLEAEVERRFFAHVDEELLAERRAVAAKLERDPNAELRTTLTRLEHGRSELMRDYYQEQRLERAVFHQQLIDVESRIAVYREKLTAAQDDHGARTAFLSRAHSLAALWPQLPPAQKRAAYSALVARVVVLAGSQGKRPDPLRVRIDWLA